LQEYGEQIPAGLSQQITLNHTIGPELTIDVGNRVAKKWKLKINALP
jgi:hypothetical protein